MKDTDFVSIIPAPAGVTLRIGKNGGGREPVFAFAQLASGRVVPLVEGFDDDDDNLEQTVLRVPQSETWGLVATWGPRCNCDDDDSVEPSDPGYCQSCCALLPDAS